MKKYYYRCVNSAGQLERGYLISESLEHAKEELKSRGLLLISVKKRSVLTMSVSELLTARRPFAAKTLYLLSSRLFFMTDSGLDINKTVSLIQEQSVKDKPLYDALRQIKIKASSGLALSEAFHSTGRFPAFFISMIEIGEKGGKLSAVFSELSKFYEWEDKCVKDVKSALTYPIIVSLLLIGVVITALTLIIPAYAEMFDSKGVLLPLPTRILLSVSDFFTGNIIAIAFFAALLVCFLFVFAVSPKYKYRRNYLQLNFPVLKKIYITLMNYRLCHASHILLSSGVSLSNALVPAFKSLDAPYLGKSFNEVLNGISRGESLSSLIKKIKYFDRILINMVETGEETGRLPYLFNTCAQHFKTELERTVKNINTLIEPVVTILLGIVICAVLMAVVLPSFSLMEAL
ncbi:MAG: type II secretion system F family protein [Clostridiales bacterium]|jgi:type IV pilus assembly protein PilC|nr:type II secretion system F family protein [Clostridiales bacterium]